MPTDVGTLSKELITTGYDMSMVIKPPVDTEAVAAAEKRKEEALAKRQGLERDHPDYVAVQQEVEDAFDAAYALDRDYFRLNIWGMSRYRDTMLITGMGHYSDQPEWPDFDGYGFDSREQMWATTEALQESGDEDPLTYKHGYEDITLTPELLEKGRKFLEAQDACLSAHPGETPGIPLWKFGSNDGWHVTPVECSSALQIFGEWLADGCAHDGNRPDWQGALDTFRTADEGRRKTFISQAFAASHKTDEKVGHVFPGEADERNTATDVLVSDYFLQWLAYLQDGVHYGGFRVH